MSNERKQSKLGELIQQYCPDGVEFFPLGSVCEIRSGWGFPNTEQGKKDGEFPFFKVADMNNAGNEMYMFSANNYIDDTTVRKLKCKPAPQGTIIFPKIGAAIGTNKKRILVTDSCYDNNVIGLISSKKIISHFLFYIIQSIDLMSFTDSAGAVPSIRKSTLEKHMIPVPPLPVQSEIVRILDNFTALTAELTAELTVRKKQYEFYRDKLLTFGDVRGGATSDVVWKSLAEIADISTGSSNTDDAVEGGCYPFFVRSQQPLAKDEYEYDEEAIITAGDGVGVGKVFHYINGKYALHQRAYRIHPATDGLLGKYLYHYFVATFPKYIGQQMYQGSVPSIRRPMLNKFQVAIPSLDVQSRIVNVLDNFDAICSDLKIVLPVEIEARKKQYEFYRDALLTYAATGIIIQTDRQTDRQIEGLILLCQYVFGYISLPLNMVAHYSTERINCGDMTKESYVGVESLLQDKKGRIRSATVPTSGTVIAYHTGDVLIGNIRPYLRKIWHADIDGGTNGDVLVIQAGNSKLLNTRYLYHSLASEGFFQYDSSHAKGAKMPRGDKDAVMNYSICIPTLDVQKRIVSILDRFDALCNDLTSGLPAEIEARTKQYEYYRDKLLTFQQK